MRLVTFGLVKHTQTNAHRHTQPHKHKHTYAHIETKTHTHRNTHTHTNTYTRTHTQKSTHTETLTHTQTYGQKRTQTKCWCCKSIFLDCWSPYGLKINQIHWICRILSWDRISNLFNAELAAVLYFNQIYLPSINLVWLNADNFTL